MTLSENQVKVIYAATQGMTLLAELIAKAREYPAMTEEEADLMVQETNERTHRTVARWRNGE